jgi:hypothetical protein
MMNALLLKKCLEVANFATWIPKARFNQTSLDEFFNMAHAADDGLN